MANKKEPVSFRSLIPAGQKKQFTYEIDGDATIEDLKVRFYPGQQKALHVTPYVKKRNEEIGRLIQYPDGTDSFLSGDDDRLEFPGALPVEQKDMIVIDVVNTDTVNDLTLVVDLSIDYYGGQSRVV